MFATTYCQVVHIYSGTSEGSIFIVHRSDGFGILICLQLREGFFTELPRTLRVLRWQISFDRDQKTAAIDEITYRD